MEFQTDVDGLHPGPEHPNHPAAHRLVEDGLVSDVRILQAGAVITGIVSGDRRVYIRRRNGASAEAECSCEEQPLCVHAAAVLIAARGAPARPAAVESLPRHTGLPAGRQQLYYRIDVIGADTAAGFTVSASVGQTGADGEQRAALIAHPFLLWNTQDLQRPETTPRYVSEEDRQILQALMAAHRQAPWELRDADGAALLQRIVATQRAFWRSLRGEPLEARHFADTAPAQPAQMPSRMARGPGAKLTVGAQLEATLEFIYQGLRIDSRALRFQALRQEADSVRVDTGEGVREIQREREGERRLQARLDAVLPRPHANSETWLTFMLETAPALQAEGWEIEVDAGAPCRIAAVNHWYADFQANDANSSRGEWFDLRLGVTVGGTPMNLLPALVEYLEARVQHRPPPFPLIGERLLIRLQDGRHVPVPVERIQRIAETLVELFDRREGLNDRHSISLPASQAGRLAQLTEDLNGAQLRSSDSALLALVEELKSTGGIAPVCAPDDFTATLRLYQQEGLGWLQFLRRHGLGGILADDMGLGKTVQTLAHLALEKTQGRLSRPALIVAPVSVIGNWQRELPRFAPMLKFLILHGPRRRELFADIGAADVVITGYPQLQLDGAQLLAQQFSFVILDEAQTIKNPRAQVSRAARALRASHRLCLTGTPMENHLGELWSLFDFAQPGLLGDERQFQRHYRTPIEKHGERGRAAALTRRVAPFMLRRSKDSVAKELPPRTTIVESIVMDERQRDLYDSVRLAMHRRVREIIQDKGLARSRISVLDALLKLRQVCCDPRLIRTGAYMQPAPSAKLEWLTTMLPELVAEGRRILLFSQFTSMLELIQTALKELSIPYCLLTGATRQRATQVARFQAGEAPVFLVSLKAGGTGLNLTAADTVIHYDPWWNPAAEAQATDRAHRIGQDKPVFVHKLIAQDTVEEKILDLQAGKQALAGQLHDGDLQLSRLDAATLEALFAP